MRILYLQFQWIGITIPIYMLIWFLLNIVFPRVFFNMSKLRIDESWGNRPTSETTYDVVPCHSHQALSVSPLRGLRRWQKEMSQHVPADDGKPWWRVEGFEAVHCAVTWHREREIHVFSAWKNDPQRYLGALAQFVTKRESAACKHVVFVLYFAEINIRT